MMGLTLQYTIVSTIVVGAIVWMVIKLRRPSKGGGCAGCALTEKCRQAKDSKWGNGVRTLKECENEKPRKKR